MSIEQALQQLKSRDPQQRKQAIIALGKSGDARALKPLASVYKTDPEPQLRDLALKAGRHLRKTTTRTEAPPEPEPTPDYTSQSGTGGFAFISDSTAASGTKAKEQKAQDDVPDWMRQMGTDRPKKQVTPRDRTRAASYVDRAMDAKVSGQDKKMIAYLEKALEINPELEKDGRTLGLLAMAFNTSSDQAVAALRAARGQQQQGGGSSIDGEWTEVSNFFIEIAIWLMLIGLLSSGALFMMFQNIDLTESCTEATTLADGTCIYDELQQEIEQRGAMIAFQVGFIYSAVILVTSLGMNTFLWIVGTFMGGQGILFGFLLKTFRALIVIWLVTTILPFFSGIFAPDSDAAILLSFAPGLFAMFYMGYAVGNAHEFGTVMGCLSMVGAVFACFGLFCGFAMIA